MKELLDQEDLQLIDVLESPYLNKALQVELASLMDYLCQDDIILSISDYVLSSKHIKDNNFPSLFKAALNILTSSAFQLFTFISSSHSFAIYLHDFLLSEDSKNTRYAGSFEQIICSHIRWTKPLLFEIFPDVGSLLIERIDIQPLFDLIPTLICNSSKLVFEKPGIDLILHLSAMTLNPEYYYSAASCLLEIHNLNELDQSFLNDFYSKTVIDNLMTATLTIPSITLTTDLIHLLCSLYSESPSNFSFSDQFKSKFYLTPKNITPYSVSAIPLFFNNPSILMKYFFHPSSHPFLHHFLCKTMHDWSPNDFNEIALIPGLIEGIIKNWGTDNWCPHMLQLAIAFVNQGLNAETLLNPKWIEIKPKILEIKMKMDEDYGGELPTIIDSPSSEECEEESNFCYYSISNKKSGCVFNHFDDEEEEDTLDPDHNEEESNLEEEENYTFNYI